MAAQIQALYPGQTATVVQLVSNLYRLNYGQVPTRQWYIQIAGNTFLAQALILASKSQGDGAPRPLHPGGTESAMGLRPPARPGATERSHLADAHSRDASERGDRERHPRPAARQ